MLFRSPPSAGDPWLAPTRIAADLGVSKMTVYRAIHAGELRSVQVRHQYRVRTSWYQEWLNGPATSGGTVEA